MSPRTSAWITYKDRMNRWTSRYIAQMKGGTIIGTFITQDGAPVFTVKMPDGKVFNIEVWQDEEGNGPGFLAGLPLVDPEGP